MLDSSTNEFVNVATWRLNVTTHDCSLRFAYGDGIIYQIGSIIADVRTGTFKNILTRIPLSGTDGSTFVVPTNLPAYYASKISKCIRDKASLTFYKRILYLFCRREGDYKTLYLYQFKDGDNRDLGFDADWSAAVPHIPTGIQVISATGPDAEPWGLIFDKDYAGEVRLGPTSHLYGSVNLLQRPTSVLSEFGDEIEWSPGDPLASIVIGWIVGGIGLFVGLIFVGVRFVRPRYRARGMEKKKEERGSKLSSIRVPEDCDRKDDEAGFEKDKGDNDYIGDKFEATSVYSYDLNGRDKILVTPDIDETEGEAPLDFGATRIGAMEDQELHSHPRPHIVTTLQDRGNATERVDRHVITISGKDSAPTPPFALGSLGGGLVVRVWPAESHVDRMYVRDPITVPMEENGEVEERRLPRSPQQLSQRLWSPTLL
ncbi:hypothetical protein BGX29_008514 [Mortierella sp. GBA35]|nr:hypothetical protein BGX29_008514 [Mortierella sp. GBA35]